MMTALSDRAMIIATLMLVASASGQATQKPPSLELQLLANVKAVQPGVPFELALAYEIQDGWHIYWKNSGDSGAPPRPSWTLPSGFTVGDLRFPAPQRYVASEMVTNILSGEPILLATVTPPADVPPGSTVEIAGTIRTLVCKSACFMLNPKVTLTLPVAAESQPANAETFDLARSAMPTPAAEAKYLKVSAIASQPTVRPKDRFQIAVVANVGPGLHVQSHEPLNEFLIATDVFLEPAFGIDFGKAQYPKAKIKTVGRQRVSEYDGKVVIRFEAQADNTLPDGPLRLAGILRCQACNSQGRCFRPQNLAWSIELATAAADTPITLLHRDIFTHATSDDGVAPAKTDTPKPSTPVPGVLIGDTAKPNSAADAPQVDFGAAPSENLEEPIETVAATTANQAIADVGTSPSTEAEESASGGKSTLTAQTLVVNMLLAALGGLILNIMPCVLPVISIKILSFVQQAGDHPRRVLQLGLAFSFGIILSFFALGVVVIILQQVMGKTVGWGFQLSDPRAVIILASVMFVFGLSLFGVFEIALPGRAMNQLGAAEAREGLGGAFMKGVLATVLATPCTAPFMGPAISFAFAESGVVILLVLGSMGVGMALPYVLLSAQPAWMKYLPRPGAWMERFKQFMGFLLMGTVVWLLWILGSLIGEDGVSWTLGFCLVLAIAAWIIGMANGTMTSARQLRHWALATAMIVSGGWYVYGYEFDVMAAYHESPADTAIEDATLDYASGVPWKKWAPGRHKQLAAQGYTVFVDYTATWCATCQTNKKFVIESDAVRKKMAELGIYPIKADYTKSPDAMTHELDSYGSAGVPLNIIIPAGRPDEPIVLPTLLVGQQSLVIEQLEAAGPSQTGTAARTP
jgi:thiol:disulfide interchange protein/DsbC/DsbD-like thiol-disulfide interchange protein